jgi:hypothetical protein
MLAMLLVNHIDYGSLLTKLFGNASANTIGATSYNNYFILEHKHLILFIINIIPLLVLMNVSAKQQITAYT